MKRNIRGLILLVLLHLLAAEAGCNEKIGGIKEGLSEARIKKENENRMLKLANKIPDAKSAVFNSTAADKFALLSLDCVDRQYPNKPGNVLEKDEDLKPPKELHPSFFGCFDWHSAVHGHWAMVKILKTFPKGAQAVHIRDKLNRHFGRENIANEAEYFKRNASATFERPYGYGWFLRLAAEVHDFNDPDAQIWSKNLKVLEDIIVERIFEYLFKLSVPVRAGTHHNTAFALVHIYDYAKTSEDDKLLVLLKKRGKDFYLQDRNCPLDYEPSGEDFISPCLAEADFMKRILTRGEFREWFDTFLPVKNPGRWESIVRPPEILDKKDPKIGHLIGLSFHRAWAMKSIAAILEKNDPRRQLLTKAALWHENEGLNMMFKSGYGGEHWLASFAIYLLTDTGLNM